MMSNAPPPHLENHLHAIIIMVLKLFFSEPRNLEYISITQIFDIVSLSTQNPTWAATLVNSFSAGAAIKRFPTAFKLHYYLFYET